MGGGHHGGHHGGGHRRGRGFGRGFGSTVLLDTLPDVVESECWWERLPDGSMVRRCASDAMGLNSGAAYCRYSDTMGLGAGDILPTIVGGDAAKAYLNETNTQYDTLDKAITNSKDLATVAGAQFLIAWTSTLVGWKAFFRSSIDSVGFLDAKSVMDQTDRWVETLKKFSEQFRLLSPSSAVPTTGAPGQGTGGSPDLSSLLSGTTGLLVAGAALAAVLFIGPRFSK